MDHGAARASSLEPSALERTTAVAPSSLSLVTLPRHSLPSLTYAHAHANAHAHAAISREPIISHCSSAAALACSSWTARQGLPVTRLGRSIQAFTPHDPIHPPALLRHHHSFSITSYSSVRVILPRAVLAHCFVHALYRSLAPLRVASAVDVPWYMRRTAGLRASP